VKITGKFQGSPSAFLPACCRRLDLNPSSVRVRMSVLSLTQIALVIPHESLRSVQITTSDRFIALEKKHELCDLIDCNINP